MGWQAWDIRHYTSPDHYSRNAFHRWDQVGLRPLTLPTRWLSPTLRHDAKEKERGHSTLLMGRSAAIRIAELLEEKATGYLVIFMVQQQMWCAGRRNELLNEFCWASKA